MSDKTDALARWAELCEKGHGHTVALELREALAAPAEGGRGCVVAMREAADILEQVGISGVALPDNWRWPLADELRGFAALIDSAGGAPAADEEAAEQFRKGWQAGFAEGRRDQQPAAVDGSVELLGALQVAELALRERGLQATGEYRQIETTLAKHAAQQAEGMRA